MLPKSTNFLIACSLVGALASGGCYGFSGGGGLPSHMNTAFVPPVQNDTPRFTLTERIMTEWRVVWLYLSLLKYFQGLQLLYSLLN